MFTLHHPIAGPKPVSVTKHALCLPGDRLTMFETPSPLAANSWDGHYYCNGQLLGISLSQAHNGLKLTHLKWRERKSVVSGKRVSVRVDLGGCRIIKTTRKRCNTQIHTHNEKTNKHTIIKKN